MKDLSNTYFNTAISVVACRNGIDTLFSIWFAILQKDTPLLLAESAENTGFLKKHVCLFFEGGATKGFVFTLGTSLIINESLILWNRGLIV